MAAIAAARPDSGFIPESSVQPIHTPKKSERITCRVRIASTIAATGGRITSHSGPGGMISFTSVIRILLVTPT
jgi:hypothetical protein